MMPPIAYVAPVSSLAAPFVAPSTTCLFVTNLPSLETKNPVPVFISLPDGPNISISATAGRTAAATRGRSRLSEIVRSEIVLGFDWKRLSLPPRKSAAARIVTPAVTQISLPPILAVLAWVPFRSLALNFCGDTLREQDVTGIAAIHHPLRDVNSRAGDIRPLVHID